MKLIWLVFVLAITAAPATYAADLKVGVVNAGAVLDQSPQKAAALARLEKEFSARSKALEAKHRAVNAAQEKLNKDGAVMSAEQRTAQERKLLSDQRDLQRLQDEYSEDLSIRRNEELRKLEQVIADTIVKLAKQDSYDVILYQGVIYASDKVDLTERVLQMLKSQP